MPNYSFSCKKCGSHFDELCSFREFDAGFPDVVCHSCKSNDLNKNIISSPPGAVFSDPKNSSKWDNWDYRQGFTAEKAKKERAAAEAATGIKNPYNWS